MVAHEKRKNSRNAAFVQDAIHVIVGILTVILAVITFLNPEENRILFPVIFFLAAFLNGMNGFTKYQNRGRDRRKMRLAVLQLLTALFLFVITVVSAISIWR